MNQCVVCWTPIPERKSNGKPQRRCLSARIAAGLCAAPRLFPVGPIRALAEKETETLEIFGERFAAVFGMKTASGCRTVCRILAHEQLNLWEVDRMCVALGLHPLQVYGDLYWRAAA